MNIYDVSVRAGVSTATISRVINQSPNVSPKTREKVMAIIKECGYTPNAFARGLGFNSMKTIGLLCADCSDPYMAQAIYYIEENLKQYQYHSILCCSGFEFEDKQKSMNFLLSKHVDAIITIGSNFVESEDRNNQYIRDAAQNVPVMMLNGTLRGENIYGILCDDYKATYDITNTLLESGRRNILFVYNSNSYSGLRKVNGYQAALRNTNIPESQDMIQFIPGDMNHIKQKLLKLYMKGFKYDAIIASDDMIAISCIKFAKSVGLSIPEDLSIVGYNNSIIAQYCEPELTSIDNKVDCLAKNCVRSLMGVLSGEEIPSKTVYSTQLVQRDTTCLLEGGLNK